MTPAGLPDGFALFTVDTTGNLTSWRYRFDASGALGTSVQSRMLASDIADTVGAVAVGNEILVAAVTGRIAPTGTSIFALDGDLAARGPTQTYPEFAGTTPFALASGDLAFVATYPEDPSLN